MDLSIETLLTCLTGVVCGVMALAHHLEKRGQTINGLTCALLIGVAFPFWLVVFYSIYFLVGYALQMFGQSLNPFPINILWPRSLLPFAPLVVAVFCWWQTLLALPYWVRSKDLSEDELNERRQWFLKRVKKSSQRWIIAYFLLWVIVQAFHRVPCLANIQWPSAL